MDNEIVNIKEYLRTHQIVTDGALGTYYDVTYHREESNPELQNTQNPERILRIHKQYLEAGAMLLRTNTFSSNIVTLFDGLDSQNLSRKEKLDGLKENVTKAYEIAQQAVKETRAQALVAADFGPIPEQGDSEFEEIFEEYKAIADAFLEAGAKLFWFETFSDMRYIVPVAEYIRERAEVCIFASFCLNQFGYTRSGIYADKLLQAVKKDGVLDGAGFNCGVGSGHMYQILKGLDFGDLIVSAAPNSGYSDIIRDRRSYQDNVSYFVKNMKETASLGVQILGGCCGTTPAYIKGLIDAGIGCGELPQRKNRTYVHAKETVIQKENNAFYRLLHSEKKPIVVELDPSHDGSREKVVQASAVLKQAGVDAITFSDSPMGKMGADSILTASMIQREIGVPVMPHISCRDRNRIGMGGALFGAHMNEIRNLLFITGDPVPEGLRGGVKSVYDFNSIRLMEYAGQLNREYFANDPFVYGGALNYGRKNVDVEIERMKKKCEAGAEYFLTQPIFCDEDIERICYIKEQMPNMDIRAKIFCGIMPLVSYRNANFMKNEVFGIHVPDEILMRYDERMSREEGEQVGIAIAVELAGKLWNVADGYYFMTPFNRASMIASIIRSMRRS